MKKLIALILAVVSILGLVGCGQMQANDGTSSTDTSQQQSSNNTNESVQLHPLYKKYPEYWDLDDTKGIEVYVWQMAGNLYHCGALTGTNRSKTDKELQTLMVNGATIEEMKTILQLCKIDKESVYIIPVRNPISSYWYEIDEGYQARIEAMFWGD